jgi:hypothetical protein
MSFVRNAEHYTKEKIAMLRTHLSAFVQGVGVSY